MKNIYKASLYIFIFSLIISSFVGFSTKVNTHDSTDYITMAKELANLSNSKAFTGHPIAYSLFFVPFLKVFPSLLTIKLLNILWLILVGIILYVFTKNTTSLLVWMFSPIVWFTSIQISPIIPISFLFLLTYFFFKKYESTKKIEYLVISGLSLGLCNAVWTGSLIFSFFFLVVFFYKKNVNELNIFLLSILPTFSVRLVLDQWIFNFPLYSYIRTLGSIFFRQIGYGPDAIIKHKVIPLLKIGFFNLIIVSPLLFYLYRLYNSKYKKELIFIILSIIFIIIYPSYTYGIILTPIIVVFLGKIFKQKEIILHILISILIIFVFTNTFFGNTKDKIILDDIKNIYEKFNIGEVIISNEISAAVLNSAYWSSEHPKFIWEEDYQLYLQNKTIANQYDYKLIPKINSLRKEIEIKINIETDKNQNFDIPYITLKEEKIPEGYRLVKCYKLLCLNDKNENKRL